MPIYLNKSKVDAPISEMCKAIRKERQITQYVLADLIGTNQTEISFIERGFIPSQTKSLPLRNSIRQLNIIKIKHLSKGDN